MKSHGVEGSPDPPAGVVVLRTRESGERSEQARGEIGDSHYGSLFPFSVREEPDRLLGWAGEFAQPGW
ncbi:hypothetical protein E2562_021328 [Oryza meyeriana var. granulata]|uniref:Uncharacterized protein n=1 Tax=Oryza meyeriana var. granulata TaxID=110450 RepID=A0A6G1BYQ5_9ORYZ|nr:hypothetical protein E2562_021328 [Oryza meyeriana var. granulata]